MDMTVECQVLRGLILWDLSKLVLLLLQATEENRDTTIPSTLCNETVAGLGRNVIRMGGIGDHGKLVMLRTSTSSSPVAFRVGQMTLDCGKNENG